MTVVGWIPYLNLLPLYRQLQHDLAAAGEIWQFRSGHPTEVNEWLRSGQVDLAPSSSICLNRNFDQRLVAAVGVASRGAVRSVYLGLSQANLHLKDLLVERTRQIRQYCLAKGLPRVIGNVDAEVQGLIHASRALEPLVAERIRVAYSSASAASVALCEIFEDLWFARSPVAPQATAGRDGVELVIGDQALVRRPEFAEIIDLGELWFELTGLPFVFAAWQASTARPTPLAISAQIERSAEHAQEWMHSAGSGEHQLQVLKDVDGRPVDVAGYWQSLHYRLGDDDRHGLELYLRLDRDLQQRRRHKLAAPLTRRSLTPE